MKKIIAAAVATAFVAPAFAADVSVSGYYEFALISEKQEGNFTNQDITGEEAYFTIKADEELANGMTVGADYNIQSDGAHYSGSSMYISGAFGKIEMGDTSGGIDSIDDKADIFDIYNNGSTVGTSNDADVNWSLPAIVSGLSVNVGYAPSESGTASNSLVGDQDNNGGGTAKLVDLGASYKIIDSLSVGYGRGEAGKVEYDLYNLVYDANGIRFAFEKAKVDDGSVAATPQEDKQTTIALSYALNDLTLKYGSSKTEDATAGTDTSDISAYGAEYSMGAATLFVEVAEDDAAGTNKDDMTAIGMSFKF